MFASLKDLAALVLAGLAALATYASIGHVHAPVVHRSAVVQPGSSDLELISGDLNTTTPPLPKPTPAPTPTSDDSQPARAGELDQGGQRPAARRPLPVPSRRRPLPPRRRW